MKNKLIYPIYAILFFFILSIGQLAISKQYEELEFPGTRWMQKDNFIGASKAYIEEGEIIKAEIETIEFAEELSIPVLPNLVDVPLTDEDK